jgi:bacterial/archaeal transporter family protein
MNSWLFFSLLSAVFAAITAILAKIGVSGINSNLATAIRTVVILIFAWGIVLWQGSAPQIAKVDQKTWIFLILSGIATGLSWLFYFHALQLGEASKVAPIDKLSLIFTIILAYIILKENMTTYTILGSLLMTAGAILIAYK